MRQHISQRDAWRLKKRVAVLETAENQRRNDWTRDYPGGVHIASLNADPVLLAQVNTARRLSHAVVATVANIEIRFYALPLPGAKS